MDQKQTGTDTRRDGDDRPSKHNPEVSLTLFPAHGEKFRWRKMHGNPLCIGEWFMQRILTFGVIYSVGVSSLAMYFQIFGVPFT